MVLNATSPLVQFVKGNYCPQITIRSRWETD